MKIFTEVSSIGLTLQFQKNKKKKLFIFKKIIKNVFFFNIFTELTRLNNVSHDLQHQDLLSSEDSESDSSSSTSSFSSSSSVNSISMLHVSRHGDVAQGGALNGGSHHEDYTNGVIENGYNRSDEEEPNFPRENMVGVDEVDSEGEN